LGAEDQACLNLADEMEHTAAQVYASLGAPWENREP